MLCLCDVYSFHIVHEKEFNIEIYAQQKKISSNVEKARGCHVLELGNVKNTKDFINSNSMETTHDNWNMD